MIGSDNPCRRECPDRSPTCHGGCDKYREWAEAREVLKKSQREDNQWSPARERRWRRSMELDARRGRFVGGNKG